MDREGQLTEPSSDIFHLQTIVSLGSEQIQWRPLENGDVWAVAVTIWWLRALPIPRKRQLTNWQALILTEEANPITAFDGKSLTMALSRILQEHSTIV